MDEGPIARMIALCLADQGSIPDRVKPQNFKMARVISLLGIQHFGRKHGS